MGDGISGPCQTPAGGCRAPGTVHITYTTAPLTGRHPGPGLTLTGGVCPAHRTALTGAIIGAGGTIVDAAVMPPPAPPAPTPPATKKARAARRRRGPIR